MKESSFRSFAHEPGAKYLNETLARNGCLGATPDQPSLAFDFNVFDVYRQLHRVCPRLGIESFTRALNNLHLVCRQLHVSNMLNDVCQMPRQTNLAEQFHCSYDCYLEILSAVEEQVQTYLNRSPSMWMKTGLCPPCMYKVIDEPSLKFSMLAAMDGNNSLKLIDSSFRTGKPRTDERTSPSPRWITPVDVDKFQDGAATTLASNVDDDDWLQIISELGSSLMPNLPICVERWKNAGPDARKKMLGLFSTSGIFLAVCRHGHVLTICDMIRSGEL